MPTITANNCQMFYEIDDFTDPWVKDKETVWLQHGVGRSTKFWYHWVPALARQYRVLRRDMRGHGQSADPGPAHRWSLDELVTDMREFMDAMGLQQVHYLGESIGGILGIIFATRWPERFKSLTICNSPTSIRPAGTKAIGGQYGSAEKALSAGGSKGWGRVMVEQRVLIQAPDDFASFPLSLPLSDKLCFQGTRRAWEEKMMQSYPTRVSAPSQNDSL